MSFFVALVFVALALLAHILQWPIWLTITFAVIAVFALGWFMARLGLLGEFLAEIVIGIIEAIFD